MTLIGNASRRRGRPWILWITLSLSAVLLMVLLMARIVLGEVVRYRGEQMEPALKHGDWLLIDYRESPRVGDVIMVEATPRPVIRRLSARVGDPVPERRSPRKRDPGQSEDKRVPEGQVYLTCDRAQWCVDRDGTGLVNSERVIGVVSGRWAPPF